MGGQTGRDGGDALDDGGDLGLGAMENGQLNEAGAGQGRGRQCGVVAGVVDPGVWRGLGGTGVSDPGYSVSGSGRCGRKIVLGPVADQVAGFEQGHDAGGEVILRGVEQFGRVGNEIGFADGGVALFLEGFHSVEEAGIEARRGIVGKAEVDGDFVGGFKADAIDFAGDPVGFGGENGLGLGPVGFVELHALAGGDAVSLEEDIEFAEGPLVIPSGLDGGGAFFTNSGDDAEATAFLGEDAKGIGAKGVHDLVGVNFADAGHETASEVFADTIHSGREGGLKRADLELESVLTVAGPLALQMQRLTALDTGQRAGDGGFLFALAGAEFSDGEMSFFVGENDALKNAGELFGTHAEEERGGRGFGLTTVGGKETEIPTGRQYFFNHPVEGEEAI